ncbi:hypothetical protein GCM10010156_65910 [Planobispora rosea]|uniref:Uncharacterized protein n=1 Tax=Planobispora rosea TaxID=35762 RepID=A0A8J3S8B5_PLARO|nr:hypothetical protein GCM10010156_65910 [Planobispora rosea]GIH87955.1 hypothetical protein Pro02_63630 [Planobispora rosea]
MRRFVATMACPCPPRRAPIAAHHQQGLIDRLIANSSSLLLHRACPQLSLTRRTAHVVHEVTSRTIEEALRATEDVLYPFLTAIGPDILDHCPCEGDTSGDPPS